MAIQFKQRCYKCNKNYVLATRRSRTVICYDCFKKEMVGEINDPVMKEMFKIPEDYYKNNSFLCDIKIKFMRYGNLSEKQVEAFKKTVTEMEEVAKSEKPQA